MEQKMLLLSPQDVTEITPIFFCGFYDFILAKVATLENQFDQNDLDVQNLVRVSGSRLHENGLEHFYLSKNISLIEVQLSKTLAFSYSLFQRNVDNSPYECDEAIANLRLRRDGQLSQTVKSAI